jgi:zinc protease
MGSSNGSRIAFAILLFAFVASASAQDPPEVAPHAPLRYQLANGLEVVLAPDRSSTRVAVVVRYDAGSSSDPEGLSGLAHLAEHMAFRGSRHLRGAQFYELPKLWGAAESNAHTGQEWTAFHLLVPAQQLGRALWLESERMAFVLEAMSEEQLELERRLIRNELKLNHGPDFMTAGILSELSYPDRHPLRSFAAAAVERDLDDIELPAVQWFYQRAYRPDNASLVLVGDFDVSEAQALIARYFASVANPSVPRISTPRQAVEFRGTARARIAVPDNSDAMQMIWTLPQGAFDQRRAALIGSATLLTKRLNEVLAHGEAIAARASYSVLRSAGGDRIALKVTTTTRGKLAIIEQAIESQLALLRSQPVAEDVLLQLRGQLSWASMLEAESPLQAALLLAFLRAPGAEPIDRMALSASMRALSAAELQAAARELLPANRKLVVELVAEPRAWYGGQLLGSDGDLFRAWGARR